MVKEKQRTAAPKQSLLTDRLSSLGRIAAEVVHEIRNPLTVIKGMVSSIEHNVHDPEFLKDLKEIIPKEIDRLNNLVENLLHLGKTPGLQLKEVEVNSLIANTLRFFSRRCRSKKISIIKNLTSLPRIKADPEQLNQVFINLTLNAIQAMPDGGSLSFSTWSLNGKVLIEISDTGHGIPEDKLKNIFKPFYSTKNDGMGLGLSIIHKIIKDHKGKMEVKSTVGKGTRFRIGLPVSS